MRPLSMLVATVTLLAPFAGALSQTPITRFEDVAGRWNGYASGHRVALDLDPSGRFTARSSLGSESGEANLLGGFLVIPLVEHSGTLQLAWDGNTLKGPGILHGKTWDVSLARADQTVGKH
jgi:hypothetical protein